MTEADLEQACIGWFRELGWNHAPGEAISPGGAHPEREHYTQVILASRLRDALSRLKSELPADARADAVKRLLDYPTDYTVVSDTGTLWAVVVRSRSV